MKGSVNPTIVYDLSTPAEINPSEWSGVRGIKDICIRLVHAVCCRDHIAKIRKWKGIIIKNTTTMR